MNVLADSTNVTTYFVLRLAADGTEATGLTITNFDLQYVRSGAAPAAKVDATALAATDSAHDDNKAIEIDATDQPGLYRVDWPDAAFAAGVREVILTVKCATAFTEHLRVNLTPVAANTVQVSSDVTAADTLELFAEALDQATGQLDSGSLATGTLTAAALAADAGNEIADALLDRSAGIETGFTPRQALRLILSALAAELSGAGTNTITIRDINDTKDRIVATVDSNGNRTAITHDAT